MGGLSPEQREVLAQQDAHFLALPLQPGPSPHSMAAHLRAVTRLLRGDGPSPCSQAMAHLSTLSDRTAPPHPHIACRKGCAHCCRQQVIASAPEAFFIAAQLHGDPRADTITAMAERLLASAPGKDMQHDIACPLLDAHNQCSLYAARPLSCHGFVSVSLEACLAAFTRGATPDIPMPQDHISLLQLSRMMLMAAARLAGLNDATYEMNAAVAVILATDNAERRWLAGEDIFAGLAKSPAAPPQIEQQIAQMAAFVAPTL